MTNLYAATQRTFGAVEYLKEHTPLTIRRQVEAFLSYASRVNNPTAVPDGQFDLVIAAGVLEHCPLIGASLAELHRVLREEGQVVITFFPNSGSVVEWIGRRAGMVHHRRLYSAQRLRARLLDHGFDPTFLRFHQFLPAHRASGLFAHLWWANGLLERTWPIDRFSANLMAIATKHSVM